MRGGEEALPVFVFPSALTFALSDPASHKQVLTLYNPYEFPIQYQILSTSPRRYSVLDPQGTLRPKCCIDVLIRHLSVSRGLVGTTDRFRVAIQEKGGQRGLGGRKDVPATLSVDSQPPADLGSFQGTSRWSEEVRGSSRSQYSFPPSEAAHQRAQTDSGSGGIGVLSVLGGIVCIVTLSLPSQGEETSVPEYLQMTLPQKLVAAYVLGLITMLVIRR